MLLPKRYEAQNVAGDYLAAAFVYDEFGDFTVLRQLLIVVGLPMHAAVYWPPSIETGKTASCRCFSASTLRVRMHFPLYSQRWEDVTARALPAAFVSVMCDSHLMSG